MKLPISIVSNIFNPVGPSIPGGLEVFNYYLTKELENRGHDVRLYASGDSSPLKSLVPIVEKSLTYSQSPEYLSVPWNYRRATVQEFAAYTKMIEKELKEKRVIHFSMVDFLPIYLAIKNNRPVVTTIHMPMTNYHYQVLYELLGKDVQKAHFICISKNQAKGSKYIHKIIPNGVNIEEFKYSQTYSDNFVSLGRMIPEKGVDDAIAAAIKAKVVLKIGGVPKSKSDQDFFDSKVKPFISEKIKYEGFVSGEKRTKLYQSKAFVFPIKWDEAFGLTIIEAMACGTPVIVYDRGAVREIVKNNETGIIVPPDDVNALTQAIKKINDMPEEEYLEMRAKCKKSIDDKFSIKAMVDQYEEVYEKIYHQIK